MRFFTQSVHPGAGSRLVLACALAAMAVACGQSQDTPDAGDQQSDAGHVDPSDSGEPLPDGGEEPTDGGEQPPDGGEEPLDGGEEPPPDGGHETPDAGEVPEGACGGALGGCEIGSYCEFTPEAACGVQAFGTCVTQPVNCSGDDAPQCGCDGNTYANACEAARAGAGVAHEGACVVQQCVAQDAVAEGECPDMLGASWNGTECVPLFGCNCVGEDCGPTLSVDVATCEATYRGYGCIAPPSCSAETPCGLDEYCLFPAEDACGATSTGTCIAKDLECSTLANVVCGCDDQAYLNACEAHFMGVSVAYDGPCGEPACRAQDARGQGEGLESQGFVWDGARCNEVIGDACSGADCGALTASLEECVTKYIDAGCLEQQACGGEAGATCGIDYFCDYEGLDGCAAPGASGVCRLKPVSCEAPAGDLRCGCDGVQYESECFAHISGSDVVGEGPCAPSCPAQDAAGVGDGEDVVGYRWDGAACVELVGTACSGSVDAGFEECETCVGADCASTFPTRADCVDSYRARGCIPEQSCSLADNTCGADSYCDFASAGGCDVPDAVGVCRLRPLSCEPLLMPHCGCDGVQYDSLCNAFLAGTDVLSDAPCPVE